MVWAVEPARPEDREGIAHLHWRGWHDTYPGIVPEALLARITLERRRAQWSGERFDRLAATGMPLVVRHEGEVIGVAEAGPAGEIADLGVAGELLMIYVHQSFQGRGVGRALFAACREWFHRHDHASFGLWVLRDNRNARRFYERLGGMPGPARSVAVPGGQIDELAYLWR